MKPALHAHHWSACLGDREPVWSQHPWYLVMTSTNICLEPTSPSKQTAQEATGTVVDANLQLKLPQIQVLSPNYQ